jgi:hypothetical protein
MWQRILADFGFWILDFGLTESKLARGDDTDVRDAGGKAPGHDVAERGVCRTRRGGSGSLRILDFGFWILD